MAKKSQQYRPHTRTFNPPPNWPLPEGFRPYRGWRPNPAWGLPPPGWTMWVTGEKKSHAVRYVMLAVALFLVCSAGSCVALVSRGASEASHHRAVAVTPSASTCQGRAYPDQEPDRDVCADQGGTVDLSGVAVTTTPLRREPDGALCLDLNFVNQSDAPVGFHLPDWRARSPSGELRHDVFPAGGDLSSANLPKGGQKSGTLCFDPLPGSGTFVTTYEPAGSPVRGVWLSTVD